METYFKKSIREARLLDHTDGFKEKTIPVEIRTDLLLEITARVLQFRRKLPKMSYDALLIEKSKKTCPFCPERLDTSTPKFAPSLSAKGRMGHGQAMVLPNAFPYSRYSGVVIFSEDHYIPLDEFTPKIVLDSLIASTIYINQVRKADPNVTYASINWNYMPPSGSGIIHPHLQVVVNQRPTRFHQKVITASLNYQKNRRKNYWSDLISWEKRHQVRYLFHKGTVVFLVSFCPRGMFGEVLSIFQSKNLLQQIDEEEWCYFAKGLSRILKCFHHLNFDSLNMTLLASLTKEEDCWVQARIIPRSSLPPWSTSDVNYFEKGHDEMIVILSPEDLADEIRKSA